MSIEIEKGLPMPAGGRGCARKYPLREMGVGDSFFVPGLKNINGPVYVATMSTGWRFAQRRENDGVRVWRTK